MRPIDADAFRRCVLNGKPIGLTICQYSKSDILAMIRDQPTVALPPNLPLTLEELREMDGEPVWVEFIFKDHEDCWMLINQKNTVAFSSKIFCVDFLLYGKTWLAYRRKSEEGET